MRTFESADEAMPAADNYSSSVEPSPKEELAESPSPWREERPKRLRLPLRPPLEPELEPEPEPEPGLELLELAELLL